jgi:hypothetical protein
VIKQNHLFLFQVSSHTTNVASHGAHTCSDDNLQDPILKSMLHLNINGPSDERWTRVFVIFFLQFQKEHFCIHVSERTCPAYANHSTGDVPTAQVSLAI